MSKIQPRTEVASGSIPLKIRATYRHEHDHHFAYRGVVRCKAILVQDADKEPPHGSAVAEEWARGYGWAVDRIKDPEVVTHDVWDNVEIPYLTLVDREKRSEGGVAFKVVTPFHYLVDLREDVFLDVLFRKGVPADGHLEGPFRWVKLGSQMRLALIDSDLYRMIEAKAASKKGS